MALYLEQFYFNNMLMAFLLELFSQAPKISVKKPEIQKQFS